jgi:alkyl hydroperoxide reductase subunit F
VDVMNAAARGRAGARRASRAAWSTVKLDNGGSIAKPHRDPGHRRALAQRRRARRGRIQDQGRGLLPHCDGPLFKGKDVAVIGGGNSGIEAAIDLAGVVKHVTVLEFMPELKADAVLVKKAAQPAQRDGAHQRPDHRDHRRRRQGQRPALQGPRDRQEHLVPLAGVFVQIGLVPNTEWLGTRGAHEVRRDRGRRQGATNVPGVFAAGDCTTVPYKQIVVAAGAGSTAALSAFDYLIRTPAPQAVAA